MRMGFYKCKDGTMVEMIFDNLGNFVRFGDDVKKEDADRAEKEIREWFEKEIG